MMGTHGWVLTIFSLTMFGQTLCAADEAASDRTALHVHQESAISAALVGRKIVVEGIAGGALEKGLGPYLIFGKMKLYVRNLDFVKPEPLDKKPLRITGVLRHEHIDKAPPGTQGFAEDLDFYVIEATRCVVLEAAERVSP